MPVPQWKHVDFTHCKSGSCLNKYPWWLKVVHSWNWSFVSHHISLITWTHRSTLSEWFRCLYNDIIISWLFPTNPRPERPQRDWIISILIFFLLANLHKFIVNVIVTPEVMSMPLLTEAHPEKYSDNIIHWYPNNH